MLRTIFAIGLMAFVGLFLLKLFFGLFGGLIALVVGLAILALKIAFFGLIIYLVVRILSPETARRWREKWAGPGA